MGEIEKLRKGFLALEKRMTKAARRHAGFGTVVTKKHLGKIVLTAQQPRYDRDMRFEFRDRHDDDYGYTALKIILRDKALRVQFRADRDRAFGDTCDWDEFDTESKLLILEGLEAKSAGPV